MKFNVRIIIIIALLTISCFLTYYFHYILGIEVVFTHFFYIPIILSCLWWGKKGLVVPIFLTGFFTIFSIYSHIWLGHYDGEVFIGDLIRALMFVLVGIVVSILSEKISNTEKILKESEEKYREAYKLINFYKDLFIHDMNNIIQIIGSSVEFYSMFQKDPEKLKEFGDISEIVKKHVRRGATLISNVRKLSKLDETEVKLSAIEISDVLNKSVESTVSSFRERNINIEVNGLSKGLKVLGNELLIDICDNLLNNAVKYNDNEKEIKIEIIISKMIEDEIPYLKIEFKDYGMGVPNERKETIFEKLYSEDISKRGMGMGLSLVKKIVDNYSGKIWIEDRVKGDYRKGSNFIVLLKEA